MAGPDFGFPFTWFRSPLSGDVFQNIAPDYSSTDIAGNIEIERRITREVASYGNQLGTILDALTVLARDADRDDPAIAELFDLIEAVDAVKRSEGESARGRARDALDSLRKTDRAAYAALIRGLREAGDEE